MKKIKKYPLLKQKMIGIAMLAACAVILLFGIRGQTAFESDCTPVLVFIPVGLALLFIRRDIFGEWMD